MATTQVKSKQQLAITDDLSFSNLYKIVNLVDPTNPQDAATKGYVDAAVQGLDIKGSVRVATTANITLSGTQTVDGVALSVSDRVLVKAQTTGQDNGIYVVSAGAWTRSEDANLSAEVTPGMYTFVEEGTTFGNTGWVLSTDAPIILGTTVLTFNQFSGAGSYVAGDGLLLTGNSFSAVGTANRITVSSGGIDIAATYTGQTSITTIGTISTGVWTSTVIGVQYGGTGANLSATGGAGQVVKQSTSGGAFTVGTLAASDIASGAALTKVDDTNVTLTLGGTPASALLAATSLTLGWAGQLAVTRGGTGQSSFTDGQLLIGNTTGNTLTKATLTQGSGIAITNGGGSITIAIASTVLSLSNIVTREVPSGTVNSSNDTFTLANTPVVGTEHVYKNGVLMNSGSGNDYTIAGGTITFLTGAVPQTGDILLVSYIK